MRRLQPPQEQHITLSVCRTMRQASPELGDRLYRYRRCAAADADRCVYPDAQWLSPFYGIISCLPTMSRAWRCTRCIDEHHGEYDDIVPRPGQIQAHRDQYCKKTRPAGRAAIARRPWGRVFSYIDSTTWKITRTAQRCAHRFRVLPLLQHDRRRW